MTTDNTIALAAVLIPTFGGLCLSVYKLIKLWIKSSLDEAEIRHLKAENDRKDKEIERKDAKIDRLRDQVREMN